MFSTVRRWAILIPAVALMCSAAAQTKDKPAGEKKSAMPAKKETAVVETSMGTFEIELYRQDAPKTVENFVKLAGQKFFDGTRFHRISKGFVIQGGDDKSKDEKKMAEWGTGGKSIYGKEFEDELTPSTPSFKEGYKKGVVAMANRGPNTNTSQFFVMLNDAPGMPKNYTIFGKVVKGLDVVDKIGKLEVVPGMSQTDGRPKTEVLMKKVTIRTEGQ
jgi:cyclophilin family peptidyl-prolyl cis-trans isomerase